MAGVIGTLVLQSGCLRVSGGGGEESTLVIWPPELRPVGMGGGVRIIDGRGRVVARVGDRVHLGGGSVSPEENPHGYREAVRRIPAACPGPYFWAHTVESSVEPTATRPADR